MALTTKRAAFFDVDNTLIRGSTIYFLGRGMYQRGYFTKKDISRFVLANLRFRLTGKENKDEIQRFQDAATDFIGGHNVKDIEAIAQEIYDEYVSPAMWQGTIDIAQALEAEGIEVYLVTAAPEDMAVLIAKRLGLTGALGSKAEIENGTYTGRMNGALLHGKEKAIAVTELAKEKGFNLSECFAFSDSNNDLPLLLCVGHPSAINPDALLGLRAMAEGWPIHDFRRARFIGKAISPLVVRLAALGTWLTPRKRRG
ncbi:MAG: haloacid dehalogenase [Actinobacteria bacterium BACL15 MAG-120619-bin91]|jgi:HAD superfamily hydrolase (TIGR01490 family)|uniref:Haloacid dehalogenase n=2 Tax=ac1 cluster TaxID=1655545 RepID=A0A0R2PRA5_9ACTN|nr:MAG: haloacid dehalogenase [Actinobacteria bacterium BACL15 MAG-120619-bin91]KRO38563.1 MAG: haloacid dehalogenase [Actinobacteria bacterium BACL15 MAG-120823-bin78]